MPSDEFGEKTEQPTERRRSEARQKGNVARSTDLSAAGLMLAAAVAMWLLGIPVTRGLARFLAGSLRGAASHPIGLAVTVGQFRDTGQWLAGQLLPFLLLMAGAALFVNVIQVGFLMAPEVLRPQWARLSPLEGAKRILSIRALAKLGVSLGKLLLLVGIAAWSIVSWLPDILTAIEAEPVRILLEIQTLMVRLAFQLALALMVLALLDFAFQKWKHEQDLYMSKHEVREEMKQMEGDPQIRQRRKEAHRKLAQARELQEVKEADVVLTNPTEIAVALKYDPETMPAPTVVAKGRGEVAARIRRMAAEHGVPIIERKSLARLLDREVNVGQTIPVELYEVFVEILAYVYQLTGRTPPGLG